MPYTGNSRARSLASYPVYIGAYNLYGFGGSGLGNPDDSYDPSAGAPDQPNAPAQPVIINQYFGASGPAQGGSPQAVVSSTDSSSCSSAAAKHFDADLEAVFKRLDGGGTELFCHAGSPEARSDRQYRRLISSCSRAPSPTVPGSTSAPLAILAGIIGFLKNSSSKRHAAGRISLWPGGPGGRAEHGPGCRTAWRQQCCRAGLSENARPKMDRSARL